jgi:DnaK suppressor protein
MSAHQVALSEEFIAQQRKRLEALRRELLGGEGTTLANERTAPERHGDEAEDFEDAAQDMSQQEINRALHDVNSRRISDINRALRKIAEGTYGLSDASGQPIPKARLEATPEAIFTVEEQQSRESRR